MYYISAMKILSGYIALSLTILALTVCSCPGNLTQPVKSLALNGSGDRGRDAKIIIFTNRARTSSSAEQRFFGTSVDPSGRTSQVRVDFSNGDSKVTFFDTLDSALDEADTTGDILIFIHGDGKGFVQTIEYCARLNSLYGVTVLAFDWPSKDPSMPDGAANFYKSLQNAKRSVAAFDIFMNGANDYFRKHPRKGSISVVFHSLGAMILQRWTEHGTGSIENAVIDNLILDAPAVKQKRHASWLSRVAMQKQIFVTMNDDDFTLHGASMLLFNRTLGMGAKPPYAENVRYIDFSHSLGTEHNYLIMDETKIGPDVHGIYDVILHGGIPDTADRTLFSEGDAPNVFILRNRIRSAGNNSTP